MTHYMDIHVLPDAEISSPVLMSALFARLHSVLVALRSDGVGVSFPEYAEGKALGTCLRLHGTADALRRVERGGLLAQSLAGYARRGDITPVPAEPAGYRCVARVQVKSSPERLRRRFMKRHGASPEEAEKRIPDAVARKTSLPYVALKSKSTGQTFKLFIVQGPLEQVGRAGPFSSYGLSPTATVPWF